MSDSVKQLVLDQEGFASHEKRKGTGGKKVHLHYTVLSIDFGDDIDPEQKDQGWYMELECSCNNQHKESGLMLTGQKWSCTVDTNGISDTTFDFKIRAASGPVMGACVISIEFSDNV